MPLRAVLPLVGYVLIGIALFVVLRKHALASMWAALVLGGAADVLLLGILNGWFLPEAGMSHAIRIAILSGIATLFAIGCLLRGKRRPLNWVALVVSVPAMLFLVVFGLGELLGSAQ